MYFYDVFLFIINPFSYSAEKELDLIMPGYTHLQRAQPIRWSHWLLCYAWQWKRDVDRLGDVYKRVNMLPLGSSARILSFRILHMSSPRFAGVGALSGHPFGIDRKALAADLGFDGVIQNSLDAVGQTPR